MRRAARTDHATARSVSGRESLHNARPGLRPGLFFCFHRRVKMRFSDGGAAVRRPEVYRMSGEENSIAACAGPSVRRLLAVLQTPRHRRVEQAGGLLVPALRPRKRLRHLRRSPGRVPYLSLLLAHDAELGAGMATHQIQDGVVCRGGEERARRAGRPRRSRRLAPRAVFSTAQGVCDRRGRPDARGRLC